MKKIYFIVPLLFLTWIDLTSQCFVTDSIRLRDQNAINFSYNIQGASLNDLSNPSQGVCGVNLRFRHEIVGDMTIEIISPAGQSIFLIGPTGFSAQTDGSVWDVNFVRCSQPAIPDIGFLPVWSNGANWQQDINYVGSYYPNSGCLEDFNTGPVNGNWLINVRDNSQFDVGDILSLELIFCDQSGINCQLCLPDGGTFALTPVSACEGDDALNLVIDPGFQNGVPDPSIYEYDWLVLQGGRIQNVVPNSDFRNFSEGTYIICGLSYLRSDASKLPTQEDSLTIDEYRTDLSGNSPSLCGSNSLNCFVLNVFDRPDPLMIDTVICTGDTLLAGDTIFTTAGNFQRVLTTANGCDSVINVIVDVTLPIAQIEPPGILTCNGTVTLDATNSVTLPQSEFIWSSQNGNIIDQSNPLMPVVNKRGDYQLIVRSGACDDTTSVRVETDNTIPQLRLRFADTINCLNPMLQLNSNVTPAGATVTWVHEDTILYGPSPIADKDGGYTVYAELAPGCIDSAFFRLRFDDEVLTTGENITCATPEVLLSATSNMAGNLTYEWTLPDMTTIQSTEHRTMVPGTYIMNVSSTTGCQTTDTIVVELDNDPPTLRRVRADDLSCNTFETTLLFNSNARSPEVSWTGPNNFMSTEINPIVTDIGVYEITITDSVSRCTNTGSYEVVLDTIPTSITLDADTLTCNISKVTIDTEVDQGGVTYQWIGPSNFRSTKAEPTVSDPGIYYVTATGRNGCEAIDSVEIIFIDDRPELTAEGASQPCNGNPIALTSSSTTPGVVFQWFGPNNFFSLEENPLVVDTGLYIVTVIASNGCFKSDTVFLDDDPPFPNAILETDTLTCAEELVQIAAESDMNNSIYRWTGPNSFTSNLQSPFVQDSGRYDVSIEGPNGCITDTFLVVGVSRDDPIVIPIALDSVICERTEIRLDGSQSSSGPEFSYTWSSSSGSIIQGQNSVNAIGNGLGVYTLNVEDLSNGCSTSRTVEVFEKTTDIASAILSEIDPTCSNGQDGMLVIEDIIGGQGPYRYSFQGSNFNPDNEILNLSAGDYALSIKDSFGCRIDTVFNLSDPDPFIVDIGQDTTIILGDSILVSALFNIPVSQISSLQWNPVNCDTCLQTYFMPENTLRVILTATSDVGCESTDDRIIRVEEGNEIFIPNAFSPNGDNINDYFTVFGTHRVQSVKSLKVFDRWGEFVFEAEDFMPNDELAGWNGQIDGEAMNPGVFVYVAEVVLFGNRVKIIKGDVTLIR